MKIEFAASTDVGRKRDHNEDTYICDEDLQLFVLCDGMGGHAAGEVASRIAADTVKEVMNEGRAAIEVFAQGDGATGHQEVEALIRNAVETACARVFEAAEADPEKKGMGTTLEMVLLVGHHGIMGHVGDSRLYMRRGGEVHQLSDDHSYVRELVRSGHMTEEEARHSPVANVITRAVGIQPTVKADTLTFELLPGDTLLLCSDGFSDYLEEPDELLELTDGGLDDSAQRLVDLANERGGKDNITTVLVRALPDEAHDARADEVHRKVEILKQMQLFKHLNFKELVKILNLTKVKTVEPDTVLIKEGERGSDFYVILNGTMRVTREGQELAELSEGNHFGEMELFTARERSATVTSKTRARVLAIDRAAFVALLRAKHQLAVKLLWSFSQTMSSRLAQTNALVADMTEPDDNGGSMPF